MKPRRALLGRQTAAVGARILAAAICGAAFGGVVDGLTVVAGGGPWTAPVAALGVWCFAVPLLVLALVGPWLLAVSPPICALRSGLADPGQRSIWLVGGLMLIVGSAVASKLLSGALDIIGSRVKNADLMVPLAVVLAALTLWAAAALAVFIAAPVTRVLTRRDIGHRLAIALLALTALLPLLAVRGELAILLVDVPDPHIRLLLAVLAVTVLATRLPPRRAVAVSCAGMLLFGVGLGTHGASAEARSALEANAGLTSALLARIHAVSDGDGDGASAWLSGGDCDDDAPGVHPMAVDVPGNGLDEDCDGVDRPPGDGRRRGLVERVDLPAGLVDRWNLLLVTVDTLRPDRTSIHGHDRETTPHLEQLARRGWVVERAYAPANATRYALLSLFSGRAMADMELEWLAPYVRARPGTGLLFERMASAGWRIEAHLPERVATTMWLGVEAGTQRYEGHPSVDRHHTVAPINQAALSSLTRLSAQGDPWALWVHYFEPHQPYVIHDGLDFGADPLDRYDSEIAAADRGLGALLAALDVHGEADRTIVVVTSDHGEEFGEHGRDNHGHQLYEESVRVPLLIAVPGAKPRRIATPATLQDVAPTIAHLLDLPPAADFGGRSLAGYGAGVQADEPDRPLHLSCFVNLGWPRQRQTALIEWPLKAIRTRTSGWVFNLADDPAEQVDLARGSGHRLLDRLAELDGRQRLATRRGLERVHTFDAPPDHPALAEPRTIAHGVELLGVIPSSLTTPTATHRRLDAWLRITDDNAADVQLEVIVPRRGKRPRRSKSRPLGGLKSTRGMASGRVVNMAYLIPDGMAQRVELSAFVGTDRVHGPVDIRLAPAP